LITMQTGPRPADFTDVRATNLAVVLRYVRANAPCSRADIAASTGLNKATVSSLVADLLDRRLVRETGLTEHRIGRPATQLVLDGAPYAAIGLEVNADHLTAVAMDLSGEQLVSWRRAFSGLDSSPAKAIAAIAALARRVVARVSKEGRVVLGLTLAVPGLVDDKGVVRLAPGLGWQDIDVRDSLVQAMGHPDYPVAVDNDANLAATAEFRYGGHAGTANLVAITGEYGVGAGVIADGRPLRGARGYGGELGHVQVDPAGPRCDCGRQGCLQAVAGIGALLRLVAAGDEAAATRGGAKSRGRPGETMASPAELNGNRPTDLDPEVDELVRRARADDPVALAALAEVGRHLGHGASVLTNVINPEVVVLGGYFVPLARWLLPAATAEMDARTLAPEVGGARLAASTLGHNAAAIGGAARVLDTVDAGHLPRLPAAR
jgi:predicted NBD/HSP70 family sugar kinase